MLLVSRKFCMNNSIDVLELTDFIGCNLVQTSEPILNRSLYICGSEIKYLSSHCLQSSCGHSILYDNTPLSLTISITCSPYFQLFCQRALCALSKMSGLTKTQDTPKRSVLVSLSFYLNVSIFITFSSPYLIIDVSFILSRLLNTSLP